MFNYDTTYQLTETRNWSSKHRLYALTKRVIDLAFSLIGLLGLAPLLAITAILIKLESPGPVLTRRRAIGRWGRPFDMYKFRTMYLGATDDFTKQITDGIYKLDYDPRVTKFGKWLRRLSVDEIPQMFNVVKGEMSLVGPRPAFPYELTLLTEKVRSRLEMQPGLTGLWQLSSKSGTYEEMVELDLYYWRHASLFLDLQILIQTIPAVLKGEGAY